MQTALNRCLISLIMAMIKEASLLGAGGKEVGQPLWATHWQYVSKLYIHIHSDLAIHLWRCILYTSIHDLSVHKKGTTINSMVHMYNGV